MVTDERNLTLSVKTRQRFVQSTAALCKMKCTMLRSKTSKTDTEYSQLEAGKAEVDSSAKSQIQIRWQGWCSKAGGKEAGVRPVA
jgi:hypothetical protein